ncbi:MAG TPA: hypothetical protein VKF36_02475 [Syntrophorhabdales bacterium]|nr:hypothetical protein [Syntrophorhabdales bacterium]
MIPNRLKTKNVKVAGSGTGTELKLKPYRSGKVRDDPQGARLALATVE